MSEKLPVCVVGAGLSGLTTMKQLADRGIAFDCYEIGSEIGGNWRYDNDNDRSAVYASLKIDTSKERFAFADQAMPDGWPAYLHHTQVLEYLENYARRFDLLDSVMFRHTVVSVRPVDDEWEVTVRDMDSGVRSMRRYSAVVVASGHHWQPSIPEFSGSLDGEILHAQTYRSPDAFIGKDVVVVGVGNTGVDLACELSWHAKSVTLAARSGAHIMPRYLFGRPLDTFSKRSLSKLPMDVQRTLYKALLLSARGRQSAYGFPEPGVPLLSQHPTVSQDVLRLVKDGQIDVQPGISRLAGDEVVFTNGTTKSCDVIINATGYEISFPFIDQSIVSIDHNQVDLYKRVVAADRPGLYFVGLIQPVGALPPLAEAQARWVAQLIDGAPIPTQAAMEAEIDRDRELLTQRYDNTPRHTIQVDYWPYLDMMRALGDANDKSSGGRVTAHTAD